MRAAHDRFWVAVGAYALMTHEPMRNLLKAMRIHINHDEITVVAKRQPRDPSGPGLSYEAQFPLGLPESAAWEVARTHLRSMLIDSFDATKEFATEANLMANLKSQDWYYFSYHLRNAYAHGNRWHFEPWATRLLPLTWRSYEIRADLHRTAVPDNVPGWVDALQLRASMFNFVDQAQLGQEDPQT